MDGVPNVRHETACTVIRNDGHKFALYYVPQSPAVKPTVDEQGNEIPGRKAVKGMQASEFVKVVERMDEVQKEKAVILYDQASCHTAHEVQDVIKKSKHIWEPLPSKTGPLLCPNDQGVHRIFKALISHLPQKDLVQLRNNAKEAWGALSEEVVRNSFTAAGLTIKGISPMDLTSLYKANQTHFLPGPEKKQAHFYEQWCKKRTLVEGSGSRRTYALLSEEEKQRKLPSPEQYWLDFGKHFDDSVVEFNRLRKKRKIKQ